MSFQYATGMCLLLENVGGSEQNQSDANVQSVDLWPSRMHAATHILQEKTCLWRTEKTQFGTWLTFTTQQCTECSGVPGSTLRQIWQCTPEILISRSTTTKMNNRSNFQRQNPWSEGHAEASPTLKLKTLIWAIFSVQWLMAAKFTPLTVSDKLEQESKHLSLLRTGGLKQLRETANLAMHSEESSDISRILSKNDAKRWH